MSNFRDAQIEAGYEAFDQDFTLSTYPTVEACHEAAIKYAAELNVEGWDLKTVFNHPVDRSAENVEGYRLEWAEPLRTEAL